MVATEPRSFTATKSMSAPCFLAARKKLRPMRPKPLIPTRMVMTYLRMVSETGWAPHTARISPSDQISGPWCQSHHGR